MLKFIKILVLALLFPLTANADFHSGDPEQARRLSKVIMQWGEIIHSTNMKFLGRDLVGGAVFHVRINKTSNRMKLQGIPEGIYVCFAGLGYKHKLSDVKDGESFINCDKL